MASSPADTCTVAYGISLKPPIVTRPMDDWLPSRSFDSWSNSKVRVSCCVFLSTPTMSSSWNVGTTWVLKRLCVNVSKANCFCHVHILGWAIGMSVCSSAWSTRSHFLAYTFKTLSLFWHVQTETHHTKEKDTHARHSACRSLAFLTLCFWHCVLPWNQNHRRLWTSHVVFSLP